MDKDYLRRIAVTSASKLYDLIMEEEDAILEDMVAVFGEASTADKKPKFSMSHNISIDIGRDTLTNVVSWTVSKRRDAVCSIPKDRDAALTEKSAKEAGITFGHPDADGENVMLDNGEDGEGE